MHGTIFQGPIGKRFSKINPLVTPSKQKRNAISIQHQGTPFGMMQTWADWALDTAQRRGATYADVRVMDIRQRDLSTKNGEVGTILETETLGIGIRVVAGGAWGFASTDRLTREGVQACAAEAVAIARASSIGQT